MSKLTILQFVIQMVLLLATGILMHAAQNSYKIIKNPSDEDQEIIAETIRSQRYAYHLSKGMIIIYLLGAANQALVNMRPGAYASLILIAVTMLALKEQRRVIRLAA